MQMWKETTALPTETPLVTHVLLFPCNAESALWRRLMRVKRELSDTLADLERQCKALIAQADDEKGSTND